MAVLGFFFKGNFIITKGQYDLLLCVSLSRIMDFIWAEGGLD